MRRPNRSYVADIREEEDDGYYEDTIEDDVTYEDDSLLEDNGVDYDEDGDMPDEVLEILEYEPSRLIDGDIGYVSLYDREVAGKEKYDDRNQISPEW